MKLINGIPFRCEPQDFFPYFGKEIEFSDLRSKSMPIEKGKGKVIGIKENAVLLRVNNIMTNWMLFNHEEIFFKL